MTMTELREVFAAWRKAETGQAVLAYNLIWLLTDPTTITEAGLRELGLDGDDVCGWYLEGRLVLLAGDAKGHWAEINGLSVCIKTLGKLRCLLLGVGE